MTVQRVARGLPDPTEPRRPMVEVPTSSRQAGGCGGPSAMRRKASIDQKRARREMGFPVVAQNPRSSARQKSTRARHTPRQRAPRELSSDTSLRVPGVAERLNVQRRTERAKRAAQAKARAASPLQRHVRRPANWNAELVRIWRATARMFPPCASTAARPWLGRLTSERTIWPSWHRKGETSVRFQV